MCTSTLCLWQKRVFLVLGIGTFMLGMSQGRGKESLILVVSVLLSAQINMYLTLQITHQLYDMSVCVHTDNHVQ